MGMGGVIMKRDGFEIAEVVRACDGCVVALLEIDAEDDDSGEGIQRLQGRLDELGYAGLFAVRRCPRPDLLGVGGMGPLLRLPLRSATLAASLVLLVDHLREQEEAEGSRDGLDVDDFERVLRRLRLQDNKALTVEALHRRVLATERRQRAVKVACFAQEASRLLSEVQAWERAQERQEEALRARSANRAHRSAKGSKRRRR